LRKVRTLKAQYQTMLDTDTSFTNADAVPDVSALTAEPYKLGAFIGITYNLSTQKK